MIAFTRNAALRIALIYFVFSLLWILLSDRFIEAVSARAETLSALQTVKGGLFIVVTSIGLYGLLRISYRRLADSEARYRSVVEDMPGLLCRFQAGGIIEYVNEAYARAFGQEPEALVGRSFLSLIPEEGRAAVKAGIEALTPESPVMTHEHPVIGASGEIRWQRWTNRLLIDTAGRTMAYQSFGLDVTEKKRAEMALHESEERLRLFVEHAPAALAMFDRQMRYLAVSRRWMIDYGLEGRNILGQSHYAIFPEIPDYWKGVHRRGMAGEVVQADQDRFERLDGSVQWLHWVVRPWRTDDGSVGGIVIFTEDMTEHRQVEQALQESRQRLFRALENIPDVVVIYDRDLRIQYINAATRAITGRPTTDFIGHRDDEVWPPEIYNTYLPALKKALAEGAVESLESDLTLTNGQVRSLHITCVPLQDEQGNVREILGITRDLSIQKAAERKIRQINLELEERVRIRTAELTAANERLQELDRLKSLFIASMSHELRTPLNSIIGFTGMIVGDMAGPISERQRDYLQRAYRAGKHLLGLITDIIDISKIEAGKLAIEYSPFALDKAMADAMASVEAGAREKGLELTLEMPEGITLHTDRKRLLQCVLNLLNNAVKYTERGKVRMMAQCHDTHIEIAVSDTGIGIPESARNQLFQPFVRLDSKLKNHTSGTGLGLYLTRKLAREILGGDVTVSSHPGEGSTFLLHIARQMPRKNDHNRGSETHNDR
ncbi:MAG: PAS domain S-box protein [Candidatus Competibacter sp.]|nr:PAS domain S-box protein [Candidatus Competibacter sp.]MDG4583211.1 PAS domain S-box protein [Candidatus Competibacter sp.]